MTRSPFPHNISVAHFLYIYSYLLTTSHILQLQQHLPTFPVLSSLFTFNLLSFTVWGVHIFMARSGALLLLILFVVVFASSVPCFESRKLLEKELVRKNNNQEGMSSVPASLFKSLVLSALPKGTVPSSSPSQKGHAMLVNEKLFARHLSRIDRILQSVPSPGVGH